MISKKGQYVQKRKGSENKIKTKKSNFKKEKIKEDQEDKHEKKISGGKRVRQ